MIPKSKLKDWQQPKTKRNLEIYKEKMEGATYGYLAEKHDISKDRVFKIVQKIKKEQGK